MLHVRKQSKVESDSLWEEQRLQILTKNIVLDIFFELLDPNDDDDDEETTDSEWLFELQEPDGKPVGTQVLFQFTYSNQCNVKFFFSECSNLSFHECDPFVISQADATQTLA